MMYCINNTRLHFCIYEVLYWLQNMVFNPYKKHSSVPEFILSACHISVIYQFKYLEHITENTLYDDPDINRELKCLFARTNLLI